VWSGGLKTAALATIAAQNKKQDLMTRLTMVTVALAAGMTAFAARAEAPHDFDIQEFLGNKSEAAAETAIDKTTTSSISSVGGSYGALITKHAAANGVPVALATAVVTIESNFRPDARGSAGEVGLMQIKPATARMMGYSGSTKGLYDPDTNIRYGMKYLAKAHQLGGGDTCGTILRYNAGHGAKRMNNISAAYCAKVKRILGH
jgi:soluble lytic murein transglycosylase-like protein